MGFIIMLNDITNIKKIKDDIEEEIKMIKEENRKFHNKTKNVSIIASGKKNVPDHLKRHELIAKFKSKIEFKKLISESKAVPPFISSDFNLYQDLNHYKKTSEYNFLFIGRIESSKKIEDIIYFFHEFLKLAPESKLTLAGSQLNVPYVNFLKWL